MKHYLLDTHILLWWLLGDKKLGKKRTELITQATNRITVSTVSLWEIVIKKSVGKLEVPDNFKNIIEENEFEILPITSDHVLYLENLPSIHQDPFDRLLIAQTICEGMTLVTADTIIPHYKIDCF